MARITFIYDSSSPLFQRTQLLLLALRNVQLLTVMLLFGFYAKKTKPLELEEEREIVILRYKVEFMKKMSPWMSAVWMRAHVSDGGILYLFTVRFLLHHETLSFAKPVATRHVLYESLKLSFV